MRAVTVIALDCGFVNPIRCACVGASAFLRRKDIIADAPWQVKDPTVSTAVYATLESSADVDYYTFEGRKGQSILLEITIPQIAGQALFAPEMALLGPGLAADRLPAHVAVLPGAGSLLIPALTGPAEVFNEPFSRTSYWERQSQRVTLPADGRYTVAVWHGAGEVGALRLCDRRQRAAGWRSGLYPEDAQLLDACAAACADADHRTRRRGPHLREFKVKMPLLVRRSRLEVSSDQGQFPTVSGSNLNRQELEFPRDFRGDLNLLFVPFLRPQQGVVNTWIPFADALESSLPEFAYYELPTIDEMPAIRALSSTRACGRAFLTPGRASAPSRCTSARRGLCRRLAFPARTMFTSCWSTARAAFCGVRPATSMRRKVPNWRKRLRPS